MSAANIHTDSGRRPRPLRPLHRWPLMWVLLLACACASDGGRGRDQTTEADKGVHCESEQGPARVLIEARPDYWVARAPIFHRPPVEVSRVQFAQAMAQMASALPREPAPFLLRLELSWIPPGAQAEQNTLVRDYQDWCSRAGRGGDCLSLLREDLYLDAEERTDMALMLAFESLWPGIEAAVRASVDPAQLRVAVFTSLSVYLGLLLLPEPTSKLVAVAMTGVLLAYLGADTLFNLVEGFKQLKANARRARGFGELKAAGDIYGRMMGERVGQVLVMVATAAVGWGSQLAMRGQGLPEFGRAAQFLKTETGLNLSTVGREAQSILIAQPSIAVTLAPAASALASQAMAGDPDPRPYRSERSEEWRKPKLTESGQVLPYPGTRSPPNPIANLGRNRAGKTLSNGKDVVRFDKSGFAEFEARFDTLIEESHIGSGRADLHFRSANKRLHDAIQSDAGLARRLGLTEEQVAALPTSRKPPVGHTWHHHQDVGRMQLITDSAHELAKPHTGGMAIWGGGY